MEDLSDWVMGASDYAVLQLNYIEKLKLDDWVYVRWTYKYTNSTGEKPDWVRLFINRGSIYFSQILNPSENTEYTCSGVWQNKEYETYEAPWFYNYLASGDYSGLSPYFKELMVINISELVEIYPSLKTLTYREIANILDAMPYIKSGESFELTHEYLSSLDINLSALKAMPVLVY